MFYWLLKRVVMGPLLRFFGRPVVTGTEHIPKHGGALIASNHLAVADSFYMPLVITRRVTFPAKAKYFTTPGIKGKLMKFFFTAAGQVPIQRDSGTAATAALETCKGLLTEGNLVGIYPEGSRSPDGRMYRGKTGVARMAIEAHVPVIPVVMVGTDQVNRPGTRMWRRARVEVHFGEPPDFSRYYNRSGDRRAEREITDEIMYELMDKSAQQYVDVYAAKVKTVMGKTGKNADQVVADMTRPRVIVPRQIPETAGMPSGLPARLSAPVD